MRDIQPQLGKLDNRGVERSTSASCSVGQRAASDGSSDQGRFQDVSGVVCARKRSTFSRSQVLKRLNLEFSAGNSLKSVFHVDLGYSSELEHFGIFDIWDSGFDSFRFQHRLTRPGKPLHHYGKSPCSWENSRNFHWAIFFHSYFDITRGCFRTRRCLRPPVRWPPIQTRTTDSELGAPTIFFWGDNECG